MPVQARVGGAFMALAVTMVIMLVADVMARGWSVPFTVSSRALCIWAAALLLGAFASTGTRVNSSRAQVIALGAAVILIAIGMLTPRVALYQTGQYWLAIYASVLVVCALVLRRSVAR